MNSTDIDRVHQEPYRLIGITGTAKLFDVSKGLIYKWIAAGLCPPGVKIGARAVRWPEGELHRVAEARVSGATEPRLRALVSDLVAARGAEGPASGAVIEHESHDRSRAGAVHSPPAPSSRKRVPAVTRRSVGL